MAQQRKRTAGDDLRDFKAGKISGNFYHNGIDRSDNYIQHTSAPRYITDENGKIIGAHIFGAHAADLVQEISALMNRETTVEQIKEMIHAHPTLSEILQECAREF